MNQIDPTSPRTEGNDSHGNPVRLGDYDSDGHFVGYIDQGGLCWESREERDATIGGNRLYEAFVEWNRVGGIGPLPDPEDIFTRYELLHEHWPAAITIFQEAMFFYQLGIMVRARAAKLN